MKNKLLKLFTLFIVLFIPKSYFGQAPDLGTTADFVLFSSDGAVSNTGITHLTGNVGTNSGSSTGFGNVNGGMHDNDVASGQASADLTILYGVLNSAISNFSIASPLGNGDTLVAGVYTVSSAATLNSNLYLNAQGNANALFIIQIQGAFSVNALSKVKLLNNAQACNVYWKVEGQTEIATGSSFKGTIVVNNAAILMNVNDTLEGRALAINGAITVDGILAYTPIGCGSPIHTGPIAPSLGTTECYALFSADGSLTNSGVTYVTGDVGTNVGLTTGYNSLNVIGVIHPIPDGSTAACAADLLNVTGYLNGLPNDIELLYPPQFGNNLTLTPHTYVLNGATLFTDTLYLDAEGNSSAVFVIKIYGALTTSVYAKVILINGAQAKNVFWMVNGAVDINDYSIINGSIVGNNGAIDLRTGVVVNGRVHGTVGAFTTAAVDVTMTSSCTPTGINDAIITDGSIVVYPNPFNDVVNISVKDELICNSLTLSIYNVLGELILQKNITKTVTSIETANLVAGVYFYKMNDGTTIIQSGKIVAQD